MSTASPTGTSPIRQGYTGRPIEIPPVEQWKPDVEFHDSNKVNGLDFPSKIRQSRFSSYKDIEGMDPFTSPIMEILVPRNSQYLASSNCLRKRNLRHPF